MNRREGIAARHSHPKVTRVATGYGGRSASYRDESRRRLDKITMSDRLNRLVVSVGLLHTLGEFLLPLL